jgi:imidazolonepropionase-like amidohydrolase
VRALFATALLVASPAYADGLIDNVNGITLDESGKFSRFNGLVITTDGKIARTLQPRDKRPERPDYRFDAKGKTVIPGLIDAHGHVMGPFGHALTRRSQGKDRSLRHRQSDAQMDFRARVESGDMGAWSLPNRC